MKTQKKYIKTVEDLLKYKDTDTVIHSERSSKTWKFVSGILTVKYQSGTTGFNAQLNFEGGETYYVEETCKPGEGLPKATTKDVGELCLFWDDDFGKGAALVSPLNSVLGSESQFPYYSGVGSGYKHCTRLTTRVVKELKEASEDD